MFDYELENNNRRDNRIQQYLIYGDKISSNKIPTETMNEREGMIVGFRNKNTGETFCINKYLLSRGLLAMGAPGTGKTNLFNIIQLSILNSLKENDVSIIFDSKGDYLRSFSNKINKENLYVIGTGEEYRNITRTWNIFAEIMPRGNDGRLVYTSDCDIDALEISASLFSNLKSEQQPIFTAMSEQIFSAILIYFMRRYWHSDQSLLKNEALLKFMLSLTPDKIISILEINGMEDQSSCINYLSSSKSTPQNQGVMSYLQSAIRKIFIDCFAKSSNKEFSMRDILKSGKKAVVFIEYDLMRGSTLAPIYGLLLDQALKFGLGGREEKRRDIYLLIDEWSQLGKLKYMASALSFGRSQGIKLMAGLQNISSLNSVYTQDEIKSIIAGFQSIVSFRLVDYESREFISKTFGKNFMSICVALQNNNLNIEREGYCVEDWDILNLEIGRAAVLLADKRPFYFKFPEYI